MTKDSYSETNSNRTYKDAAVVGLGRMGLPQARRLADGGFRVRAFDLDSLRRDLARDAGLATAATLDELCDPSEKSVDSPLAVFIYLPAGDPVDETITALSMKLRPGDLILNCGNCYFKDARRHAESLAKRDIFFMDVGVSGGVSGARDGACLMAGGDSGLYRAAEPLLRALAGPDACLHVGPVGWGHLVKTVHNGIEYGFLQAIAEGLHSIEARANTEGVAVDLQTLCETWNRGSIIESRLMADAAVAIELARAPDTTGKIGGGQTGGWAREIAEDSGVAAPVLTAAIAARERSRTSPDFSGKVISAIRNVFGSHVRE